MYRARHAKRTGGPKVGKLLAMTGLAGALVLSLAAPAALAGPKSNSQGGSAAYVTDDRCQQQLEQNQIASTSDIFVNLKLPGNESTVLVFTIYENGTSGKNSTIVDGPRALEPTDCDLSGGNLWYVDLGITLDPGSYTLVVDFYFGGKNLGSDSFLVY